MSHVSDPYHTHTLSMRHPTVYLKCHVTCMNASGHTRMMFTTPHTHTPQATPHSILEMSCHIYEWVMSYINDTNVTHTHPRRHPTVYSKCGGDVSSNVAGRDSQKSALQSFSIVNWIKNLVFENLWNIEAIYRQMRQVEILKSWLCSHFLCYIE